MSTTDGEDEEMMLILAMMMLEMILRMRIWEAVEDEEE